MKCKLLILILCFIACLFSACSFQRNSSDSSNPLSSEQSESSSSATNPTSSKADIPSSQSSSSSTSISAGDAKNVDYSVYTGNWICKEKQTSMEIQVDASGNVEGDLSFERYTVQ